jgi:hypothetical protein
MIGGCVVTDLCPESGYAPLSIGGIVGISAASVVAAGGLAVGAYVAFKIAGSTAATTSGGSAGDFAAE